MVSISLMSPESYSSQYFTLNWKSNYFLSTMSLLSNAEKVVLGHPQPVALYWLKR